MIFYSNSETFLSEFFDLGGLFCLQELCILPDIKETDKCWALKILISVAKSETRNKEIICESYG